MTDRLRLRLSMSAKMLRAEARGPRTAQTGEAHALHGFEKVLCIVGIRSSANNKGSGHRWVVTASPLSRWLCVVGAVW